ncbi:MAG: hypothetical protein Q4F13_15690 [Pseudomonadota bacterium]|nr:hypothetical protein [Pseudomonadota bacterium]
MNHLTRRALLAMFTVSILSSGCSREDAFKDPMAQAASFVKPQERWAGRHLYDFLKVLPPEKRLALKTSHDLLNKKATLDALKGAEADALEIRDHLFKLSNNILLRPWRKAEDLDYHEVVMWTARKLGVPEEELKDSLTTFELEKKLYRQVFVDHWDKLTEEQRRQKLDRLGESESGLDRAAIAAMSGSAAWAALSGAVAFTGFAFYTTMSTLMAAGAGLVGVTLPFAAFSGAASTIAAVTGPVGWAVTAVAFVGGVALAGRAKAKKSAALIMEVHALKVLALKAANKPIP